MQLASDRTPGRNSSLLANATCAAVASGDVSWLEEIASVDDDTCPAVQYLDVIKRSGLAEHFENISGSRMATSEHASAASPFPTATIPSSRTISNASRRMCLSPRTGPRGEGWRRIFTWRTKSIIRAGTSPPARISGTFISCSRASRSRGAGENDHNPERYLGGGPPASGGLRYGGSASNSMRAGLLRRVSCLLEAFLVAWFSVPA